MKKITLVIITAMSFNCFAADDLSNIKGIAHSLVSHSEIPGAAVVQGTCKDYKTQYAGKSSINADSQINTSSQFNLGSNGKSILTTTIAIMVHKGLLSWDESLPDNLNRPELSQLNLKDFLMHKSGLPALSTGDELNKLNFQEAQGDPRIQFAKHALNLFDKNMYGKVLYSNAGYVITSLIIEGLTGNSYQYLIKNHLLKPMKLAATFSDPIGNKQTFGHFMQDDVLNIYNSHEPTIPSYLSPAGNISMTLEDYSKFLQLNLCGLIGKSNHIIPSRVIKNLHKPDAGQTSAYGWGVDIIKGHKTSYHVGGTGTFSAVAAIVPEKDFFIAILVNSGYSGPAVQKVIERIGGLDK